MTHSLKALLSRVLVTFVIISAFSSTCLAQSQTASLSLSAKVEEHAAILKKGVVWYIYDAKTKEKKGYRFVAKYTQSHPNITLLKGEYLITATYGQAYLTKKITLERQTDTKEIFVINAGGLSVSSHFDSPLKVKKSRIKINLYSGDTDQFGNRSLILKNIPADKTIMLNAGIYHIVSHYGDVNAISKGDITVESGKITTAILNHNASHVTFKLVKSIGGDALANTHWELLSSVGESIKKSVGALPRFILKSGDYVIRASRDGATFEKKFTLVSGQSSQIEVLIEES